MSKPTSTINWRQWHCSKGRQSFGFRIHQFWRWICVCFSLSHYNCHIFCFGVYLWGIIHKQRCQTTPQPSKYLHFHRCFFLIFFRKDWPTIRIIHAYDLYNLYSKVWKNFDKLFFFANRNYWGIISKRRTYLSTYVPTDLLIIWFHEYVDTTLDSGINIPPGITHRGLKLDGA